MTLNNMRILFNLIDHAYTLKIRSQAAESPEEKQELNEQAEFYLNLSEKLLQHIRNI